MQLIQPTTFDPTQTNSGTFRVSLANGGWLVLINDSPSGLILTFGNGEYQRTVPPSCLRSMPFDTRINDVAWVVDYTLPVGQAPVSIVVGECYNPGEWEEGEIIIPLVRQVNQGNPVSGGVASSVVNDGNASGTQVLEATQSGSTSSNAKIDNAGNVTVGEWTGSVFNKLLQVIANAAAGADSVVLGKAGNFFVHLLGKLTVDNAAKINSTLDTTAQINVTQVGSTLGGTNFYVLTQTATSGVTAGTYILAVNTDGTFLLFDTTNNGAIFGGNKNLLKFFGDITQPTGKFAASNDTTSGFTTKVASGNLEFDVVAPASTARGIQLAAIDASNALHGGLLIEGNGVAHPTTDDASTKRQIATYIGTTDPSGRAGITVNEGDVWLNV